jgi:hypothetical protein
VTTPPEPPPADSGLGERVSSLEAGQTSILGKLDQLLGAGGPADPPATEAERPEVNISEEIRRQLADARKADAKRAPAAPAAPSAAELTEKAPKAPVRRVTKMMWGSDE